MNNSNTLVLVDGSSYLFRAYFAAPPFTTSSGLKTGTVYVFTNMIKSLMKKHPSSRFAVLFDAKGPTFRHQIYPEYKANRPPMPSDLKEQVDAIHAFLRAMGIPIVSVSGVEADDVIGTISKKAAFDGISVLISTGDKDMAQLVTDKVLLVDTMKDEYYDVPAVIDKHGVEPSKIIDFLALKGDNTDNIPGVDGIGDKAAIALISSLGGISDIYNKIDQVADLKIRGAKRIQALLSEQKESAELSYELATINVDVDLDFSYDELLLSEEKTDDLISLCKTFELNKWLTDLTSSEEPSHDSSSVVAENIQDINNFVLKIPDDKPVSFLSLGSSGTNAIVMSSGHETLFIPIGDSGFNLKEVSLCISILFSGDRSGPIVSELWKSEFSLLDSLDIQPDCTLVSLSLLSMIKCYQFENHSLDGIAQREINELLPKFDFKKDNNETILKKAIRYSEILLNSYIKLSEAYPDAIDDIISCKDSSVQDLSPLALEHRLERHIYNMEKTGVLIDTNKMNDLSLTFHSKMDSIAKECHSIAGTDFNLSSPKEVSRVLFEHLGIKPIGKKGKSGSYSTKEEVLEKLSAQGYEIARLIGDHRSISKLLTTYVDKLPIGINIDTGRIHTTYHQNRTKTGRLSSTDPNLQNIPVKSEDGRRIRCGFVAQEGHKILALDYSQIELRIMAHLSQDEALIEAFNLDKDIHAITAASIKDVSLDDVTESM